jgi:anti-sigma regulatory factor (Ser/Thr protein kinase)
MPYHRCPACSAIGYTAAALSSASACPGCSVPLTAGSKVAVVPDARHHISRRLRAQPQAAAEARRAIVALALPEWTYAALALVVTELVTNSVLHAGLTAGDTVDLRVDDNGSQVRVVVHDRGPGFTAPEPSAEPLTGGGKGLVITAALSDSWGVDCDAHGCTVWCDVPSEDERPAWLRRNVTTGHVAEPAFEAASTRMNASCPP